MYGGFFSGKFEFLLKRTNKYQFDVKMIILKDF